MKIKGTVAREKLSTTLNDTFIIPDLGEWIDGYDELPDKEKIAVDLKHLTSGDTINFFTDNFTGKIQRRKMMTGQNNDIQIFKRQVHKVINVEDADGNRIEEAEDICNTTGRIATEIITKTVDYLYDHATATDEEIKNS